ncbi:MAG: hypothetical protein NXI31_09880 [bacterium]|nr:hypothetical protein [bacterium]
MSSTTTNGPPAENPTAAAAAADVSAARRSARFGFEFLVLCGIAAGVMVSLMVPTALRDGALELRDQVYRGDWQDEPFLVTDSRRLPVPFAFGDFDLQAEIELAEGATVDIIVRRVEPRRIGAEMEPFHGRFSVLRLSADKNGPAWLSREDALLGDREAGGVDLAPGHTATVWIKGRGRALDANVAGRKLPRFLADDLHGSFLIVARGGSAVVRSLLVTPHGLATPWLWNEWTWVLAGALLGVLLATVIRMRGASPWRPGVALVLAVWVLAGSQQVAPLQYPPPGTMLAYLFGCGAVVFLLVPRTRWVAGLGVIVLVTAPPLRHSTASLDEVFDRDAGSQLVEAHAQLVRGPFMIHDPSPVARRVFLLGGQWLYARIPESASPDDHLEGFVTAELRSRLGLVRTERIDVPCLPTLYGHATQQWDMFSRYYTGYRPEVIVFGVTGIEAEHPVTGRQRPGADGVREALKAARAYCDEGGVGLVLLTGPETTPEVLAVVREFENDDTPFVQIAYGEKSAAIAGRLAAAIVARLPQ